MDTVATQWPQIVLKPPEENATNPAVVGEKRPRPARDIALNCPRCNSTNTKFCYYNNYSLTQPRYFCKACRRYWTQGGSLRNIPVGGGSRKHKQKLSRRDYELPMASSVTAVLPTSAAASQHLNVGDLLHDLHLGFPSAAPVGSGADGGLHISISDLLPPSHSPSANFSELRALTGLVSGSIATSSIVPVEHHQTAPSYQAFPFMHEFKDFPLDFIGGGGGGGYGGSVSHKSSTSASGAAIEASHDGSRLLFPFDNLKPEHSTGGGTNNDRNISGYWTGMIGGGSW